MEVRQFTRIDIVRNYVDAMLLENEDDENRRCGYVHLYGVGMSASFIALKRGHDRAYSELAGIAGMLHDFISYSGYGGPNHAHDCEPIARDLLIETKAFTEEEINMICQAVYNHSDKQIVGSEFDEIIKDADVMQHWLRNPKEDYYFDSDRTRSLIAEFGLKA